MLETDCLSLPDVITNPKGNSTDGSSFVKPSTHQIHPSVSVYSKKTEGSSWSSLGDVETLVLLHWKKLGNDEKF